MSRVKNSVATRARRKRVLKLAKGYLEEKVPYIKLQTRLSLSPQCMRTETEEIIREISENSGLQESMLLLEAMGCLIVLSCMRSEQKESNLIERF